MPETSSGARLRLSVEDDPYVARHRLVANLAQQPAFVDVVEQTRQRRL
jgi:hypothetical protein